MAFKAEELDLDSFLNLDSHFASPSLANLNKGKNIVTPQFIQPPIEKINTYAPLNSHQTFSGPSHQYDQHKQHIPLPPGALANSLAAAQRPNIFNSYQNYAGIGSSSGFYDMGDEFLDFGATNGHRSSYGGSNDIEMDFDSPVDGLYTSTSDFIDPNALGCQEEDSPIPARAEIVRVYPGMHAHQAQQAALAKQQQMEIRRQQQQTKLAQQQQQQQSQVRTHHPSVSRSSNKAPVDPVVEERISRILDQMRQTPVAPIDGISSDAPSPPASSSMIKSKKEEDEMDEDERLLASEEGKKLSSKERRQLRNKVSARAFRSRRKEYIGQLEGEVAQKSNEADTLRSENEALKAENTRLTDLTKLLLSSSAFSTFLNDLSTNGLPASILSAPAAQPSPAQSQQIEAQSSQVSQPVMKTIIEDDIDFNALDTNDTWNSGMDFSFAPQVFAVLELPEGPIIDSSILSGKCETSTDVCISEDKQDRPIIEVAPRIQKTKQEFVCDDSVEIDESDPAFALFVDSPCSPSAPVYEIFGSVSFEKATATYDLVVEDDSSCEDDVVSAATMARFERLCSALDSLTLRLEDAIRD